MTPPPRAILFNGAGFVAEPRSGFVLTQGGVLGLADGDAAVRQAILLLISTAPGERVMRPGYGCHLHRLVFAPNDDTTAGLAIHYVRQALLRWEPRIAIIDIDAGADLDFASYLNIRLDYRIRRSQAVDTITFALDLQKV
ncbi:hypothetical protein Rhe02_03070 [Rhizocola hellebori]|uniref:IraD/Gp25-like domain-containing protein n=1 Tax=Rhizocola hellebori TaxID=1392758 RepID=A0A8J3Q2S8_9ACTN|nr:GPW/gp25 family protein [Rhizocola hellebori]GIH02240.1 hypothetical protein Rhe02_03070 [Rhizocola hellebori]